MLKLKLKIFFATLLSLSVCFGFSAFKLMQSQTAANYSHAKECQKEHYLQLDCFDSCNGQQVHAQSQHQHNVPVEIITVTAFDALLIEPLKIVPMKQTVTQIPFTVVKLFFASFYDNVFRPPLFL